MSVCESESCQFKVSYSYQGRYARASSSSLSKYLIKKLVSCILYPTIYTNCKHKNSILISTSLLPSLDCLLFSSSNSSQVSYSKYKHKLASLAQKQNWNLLLSYMFFGWKISSSVLEKIFLYFCTSFFNTYMRSFG